MVLLLWIFYVFSVLCLLCLWTRLFICALWSPGKGLTSWLLFVVSNCEFVTFPLVSWVRCGTWLYQFLIFAPLFTLEVLEKSLNFTYTCLYEPSAPKTTSFSEEKPWDGWTYGMEAQPGDSYSQQQCKWNYQISRLILSWVARMLFSIGYPYFYFSRISRLLFSIRYPDFSFQWDIKIAIITGITKPQGYKTFSMLNSAKHKIYPTHKC